MIIIVIGVCLICVLCFSFCFRTYTYTYITHTHGHTHTLHTHTHTHTRTHTHTTADPNRSMIEVVNDMESNDSKNSSDAKDNEPQSVRFDQSMISIFFAHMSLNNLFSLISGDWCVYVCVRTCVYVM